MYETIANAPAFGGFGWMFAGKSKKAKEEIQSFPATGYRGV